MDLVIIGGGSNTGSIIDFLGDNDVQYDRIRISDDNKLGEMVGNIQIDLKDSDLEQLDSQTKFIVAYAKDMTIREKLYHLITNHESVSTIFSKYAYISQTATVNRGCIVMPTAVIRNNVVIGENVLINTSAIVEHDCIIKSHSHIAPGAVLLGGVEVGKNTIVGGNSTVLPNIIIGNNCTIGAGSVVTKNVHDNEVYFGNPAKKVRENV